MGNNITSCQYRHVKLNDILKQKDHSNLYKNIPEPKRQEIIASLEHEASDLQYHSIVNYFGLEFIKSALKQEETVSDEKILNNQNLSGQDFKFTMALESVDLTTYRYLSKFNTKDDVIIDIGCDAGFQSMCFDHCYKYIGVDIDKKFAHNKTNSLYFITDGLTFLKNILPTMDFGNREIFIISNYLPDEKINTYIKNNFKNHYIYYPDNDL